MATVTPDTISAITGLKTITSSILSEVGGVLMLPGRYPQVAQAFAAAVVKQVGGGTGTLVIWDFFGEVELGRIDFTNSSWEGKSFQLSGLPTPNEDGVAYLEFQMKSVGGTSAKIFKAALEYS
jgi:hypothetical protein